MTNLNKFFRKKFAIPPEKGGWVWWIGPLVIGAASAGTLRPAIIAVAVAAFAAFCMRQPLTLWIKSFRLASLRGDRAVAGFWVATYAAVCVLVAIILVAQGHLRIVALAIPSLPVFAWHFYLVARGSERRQMARDVLAALSLAFSGTAAYWACGGNDGVTAALVWLLPGLQSSASVVHMFLRLEQRRWQGTGTLTQRLRTGMGAAIHHVANVALGVALCAAGYIMQLTVAAFIVCLAEGVWSIISPQVGHTPKRLGMRQLAVSTVFTALMCAGYLAGR